MMVRFPVNYLILEGPDLSGKSTFYNALHKKSGYAWNIQDRSSLSMCVHAVQYGRDIVQHKLNFDMELLNLNNKFVLLLPDFQNIVLRYSMRGDEIQSLDEIKKLYSAFSAHASQLENFPNVFVLRDDALGTNVCNVHDAIKKVEQMSLGEIALSIQHFVVNSPNSEATPLSFTLYDDGVFSEADPSIIEYEAEKIYYNEILNGMLKKMRDEFAGRNPYQLPQRKESRRFIHTNDSCLSLIHAVYRDNILDMHFIARSSEVKTTFPHDLKFLFYLTKCVYRELNLTPHKDIARMRFNLNSAHILV
jgi:hypothetical protein